VSPCCPNPNESSPDPTGYESGDPNLYSYARGNPCRLVDPSGLASELVFDWDWLGEAFAAGGKCALAVFTLSEEIGTIVFSAFAFASTTVDGPVGIGIGSAAYGVAVYNLDYTVQTLEWCGGGDVPTADSIVVWHPEVP
jgi:hypothetical protein